MLIKQVMATEMENLQETVANMLKESLAKTLDHIEKPMTENSNILWSLKELAENHADKFNMVFNKIDTIQTSLRKTEKHTSSCITEVNAPWGKNHELEDIVGLLCC